MRWIVLLAIAAGVMTPLIGSADEPDPWQMRTVQRSLHQLAPNTAWFDTTLTTSGSSDVNVYFGFVSDMVSIRAVTADVTVTALLDSTLHTVVTGDTLQYPSSRTVADQLPRVTSNGFTLEAGQTFSWPLRWGGVRIEGSGVGTCIVMAGASPLWGGN